MQSDLKFSNWLISWCFQKAAPIEMNRSDVDLLQTADHKQEVNSLHHHRLQKQFQTKNCSKNLKQ